MSTTYGPWKPTPFWAQLLGFKPWRRSRYASSMIGGGWDGHEYSDEPTPSSLCSHQHITKEADRG